MTISEQLIKVRDGLAEWVRLHGGTTAIVSRTSSLVKLLALKPRSVRVVLLFDSEMKRGEFEETGRVDRKFKAFISVGEGLRADKSESLTDEAGFYDLCEEVREIIRFMQVENAEDMDELVTNYLGMSRFELDGTFTDDMQIDFELGTQLPLASVLEAP